MKYNISVTKTKNSRLEGIDFTNLPFGRTFSDHMFVVDYVNGAWVNPRIEPLAPFEYHPALMSIHYGQSIFEGMKASKSHDGTPLLFRPEMHAERINASAERLCMPHLPEDLFMEVLHKLIALDAGWIAPQEGSALYVRPFMFATDEFLGVRPSDTYRFAIITGPVGPYYDRPVRLWVETEYVRASQGGTGEAKAAGNYAASLLPARKAVERGYDQIMWLDGKEFTYIQEVGTMNIFFVIDGTVLTPATDGAILKGITRDTIIQLLQNQGVPVEVRPITIHEIVAAWEAGKLEEVFGTGTAAVVSQVSEIAYKDKVMQLPPIEGRKISPAIKVEIDSMRAGKGNDPFGWVIPVESLQEEFA